MKYYKIIEHDLTLRRAVCKRDGSLKVFTRKEAKLYIERHSYKGMSFHYEMIPIDEVER
jgi:hypothetical protein